MMQETEVLTQLSRSKVYQDFERAFRKMTQVPLNFVRRNISCSQKFASCEPTSRNSKFSLLPYQPFDLANKQLSQPSYVFLQQLVYGLEYNGDVVLFGSARATAR